MGPLPIGRTSWLKNGGDPNHLPVLGWSSKFPFTADISRKNKRPITYILLFINKFLAWLTYSHKPIWGGVGSKQKKHLNLNIALDKVYLMPFVILNISEPAIVAVAMAAAVIVAAMSLTSQCRRARQRACQSGRLTWRWKEAINAREAALVQVDLDGIPKGIRPLPRVVDWAARPRNLIGDPGTSLSIHYPHLMMVCSPQKHQTGNFVRSSYGGDSFSV